jgi:hypothetical protein
VTNEPRVTGIDVQEGGWAVFKWHDHEAARPTSTLCSPP